MIDDQKNNKLRIKTSPKIKGVDKYVKTIWL
jgi:hypothetical protein